MSRGNHHRTPSGQGVVSIKRGTRGAPAAPVAPSAPRARARAATTTRARGAPAAAPPPPPPPPPPAAARTVSALSLAAWCCVLLLGSGGVGVARADDALNVKVVGAFDFAGKQLTVLTADVLTEEGVFTDYTDEDGKWLISKGSGDDIEDINKEVWTSGMVAGMFWYQYEATGELAMKTAAEFYCKGLEGVENLNDNDLGFQVLNSYGLGYRLSDSLSDKEEYLGRVLTGAESLYEFKWDENIQAFWSWENPARRPDWDRAVNVDMIMNMEIMLWAKLNGGEDRDSEVEGHADTTWRDIVRPDNSTNHVADYDIDDGTFLETGTYQGYVNDSTWTRGQAWSIYGYAMIYRYIPEPRFLSQSLGLLGYWEENLPDDYVPPADFDAPASASDNGKDSSATAVVASALLEIFVSTGDPIYLVKAQTYLSALLQEDYYIPDATDGYQSILRRATAAWGEPEVGATFGDYFLLEAMLRYQKLAPSILLWQEAAVEVAASGGRRRRLIVDNTREGEEGREEVGGGRRLQELTGGEFCALVVSEDRTLSFEDPDCVPIPPDFSATPAPADAAAATPSPTTASRGGVPTPGPVATEAPVTLAPLAPGETSAPTTPVPTIAPSAGGTEVQEAVFGALALDSDVDLSYLSATSPIFIRFAVTLDDTISTPATLSLENSGGTLLATEIPAPTAGWQTGTNSVSFEVAVGTFVPTAWTEVVEVTVGFASTLTAPAGAATAAAVDWLVITNELIL